MSNIIYKKEKEYTSNNLFAGAGIGNNRDVVMAVAEHERKRADSLFADWIRSNMIKVSRLVPGIKNVIFNEPATIVFWRDGTKTVVKSQTIDIYDPEKGLAMAIAKKALGNKGSYYNEFSKYTDVFDKYDAHEMARLDSLIEEISNRPRPDSNMSLVVAELVTNMLENNRLKFLKSNIHVDEFVTNDKSETVFYFTINKVIPGYADSIELMIEISEAYRGSDVLAKHLIGPFPDAQIRWSPTLNGSDYDWHDLTLNDNAKHFLFTLICDTMKSLSKNDMVNPYEIV